MRVLLLTQVLPYPPDSGPQVKTFAVARALAALHELTIVSFVRGDETAAARQLEQIGARVYTVPLRRSRWRDAVYAGYSLLRHVPFLMARDESAAMRQLILRLARTEPIDVVHIDQLNMAQFAGLAPRARRVLDLHNALWQLAERLALTTELRPLRPFWAREAALLRRYEAEACQASDAVLTVSSADRDSLLGAARRSAVLLAAERLHVVPICLDPTLIPTAPRPLPREPRVLHLGTLAWPPNADGLLWLLRQVWPLVRQQEPKAILDVVGQRPPRQVLTCAGAAGAALVHGYVDDLAAMLRAAAVLVVPLRAGSGMRVKILTALAHGIPIVSTRVGCEGIDVRDGEHVLIADDAQSFADSITRIVHDPALAESLALNGRRLIEERYEARSALQPLHAVYRALESAMGAATAGMEDPSPEADHRRPSPLPAAPRST